LVKFAKEKSRENKKKGERKRSMGKTMPGKELKREISYDNQSLCV